MVPEKVVSLTKCKDNCSLRTYRQKTEYPQETGTSEWGQHLPSTYQYLSTTVVIIRADNETVKKLNDVSTHVYYLVHIIDGCWWK